VGVPKFFVNFEAVLSRARGNLEEQNTVLEPSIIIINNYIIKKRDESIWFRWNGSPKNKNYYK